MLTQTEIAALLAAVADDHTVYPASNARLLALAKAQYARRPPAPSKDRGPAYVEAGHVFTWHAYNARRAGRYMPAFRADIDPEEVYDPWVMPNYDPKRYWLFPLTAEESLGGDVPAVAAVKDGRIVAIFRDPPECLPLAPGRSRPSRQAVRKAIGASRAVAKARWGADVELWRAATDDGYMTAECIYLEWRFPEDY